MAIWNPWHGCKKYSSGCMNCYVYRRDGSFGKDSSIVAKTAQFDLPMKKKRDGSYKITEADNPVYTCMTSDFFIDEADEWRDDIWKIIRQRQELEFKIITKRVVRIMECLPHDWGEGYGNVTLIATCENQEEADRRLPVFLEIPSVKKEIILEPLLGKTDISSYLSSGKISHVVCGGESGENVRPCDYDWVLDLRRQCIEANVSFYFKQTGTFFIKGGKQYHIERKLQISQAQKAGINYTPQALPEIPDIFLRLSRSEFRSRFKLSPADIEYINEKGMDKIKSHTYDFIRKRLAPEYIPNDGKQTPMRGHPAFLAQHACACCCRDCLNKWYGIEKDKQLSEKEIEYIVDVLMHWIEQQYEK